MMKWKIKDQRLNINGVYCKEILNFYVIWDFQKWGNYPAFTICVRYNGWGTDTNFWIYNNSRSIHSFVINNNTKTLPVSSWVIFCTVVLRRCASGAPCSVHSASDSPCTQSGIIGTGGINLLHSYWQSLFFFYIMKASTINVLIKKIKIIFQNI